MMFDWICLIVVGAICLEPFFIAFLDRAYRAHKNHLRAKYGEFDEDE